MPQTPPLVPTVDIVDAAFLQRLAAAHVVLLKGIAAVDDGVAGLHQLCQRSIVASVILPAGSITQAVRGVSSLSDEILQIERRRVAPSAASAATAFGSLS